MMTTEQEIREQIIRVAKRNIGYGEVGKNNEGVFVKAIGGIQGDAWCAAFAGWCYEKAWEECKTPFFIKRSTGAKKMGNNIAAVGHKFMDVNAAKPGDVVVWHRGLVPWQGHIGIVEFVEDGILHTIEGNVGAFPAKVKRLVHDVKKEKLAFFASPF